MNLQASFDSRARSEGTDGLCSVRRGGWAAAGVRLQAPYFHSSFYGYGILESMDHREMTDHAEKLETSSEVQIACSGEELRGVAPLRLELILETEQGPRTRDTGALSRALLAAPTACCMATTQRV